MFYNRINELKFLETKFSTKEVELLIFWGRRRIGKSFLLKEFCDRKNGLFLISTSSSTQDNLESFSFDLANHFNDDRLKINTLKSWDEFFVYIDEKVTNRTFVVIDEYPYLVENKSGISSIFQKYWDSKLKNNKNLVMVLNGSAISMMEKETLEYRAPLYGRRTGQWFLEPFDVISANTFFGYKSMVQAIESFVVAGGVPYYCSILSNNKNLFSAIQNKILSKGEALFEEVDFLLRQEFKTPRSYFPILKTISQGAHKFGEISSKTGYDKSNLVKYISTLEKLKLIRREVPITEAKPHKSRKSLYFLNDYFTDFWFNFVFPHLNELEFGNAEKILNEKIKPHFDYYVSRKVEPIILDLLKHDYFNLNLNFNTLGRYWDNKTEIDIWGETEQGELVLGEIKWTKTKCAEDIYFALVEKGKGFTKNRNAIYLLISKSGFTKEMQSLKNKNLILIDLQEWKL